ncbi:hypothetical protein DRH27_03765 [Candidatus Falkowbacteria bacterium]|nr:MAG: hypothetical protein DRH27_03765 [Candidatus Falkowbacteria bacterium]
MNGKNILIIMVSINIVYLLFSFSCATASGTDANTCPTLQGSIISNLFNLDSNTDLWGTGLTATDSFSGSYGSIVDAQSGTSAGEDSGFSFGIILDGLKMVLGLFTLLTPFPIIDLIVSLEVPLIITMFFVPFLIIIYALSLMEFIRGANFGSS